MNAPSLYLVSTILLASVLPAQWAGEWKFDETSGTTAADSTANKNDGTLVNFSGTSYWGAGKFKNALTFDGVDDHVVMKTGKGLPVYSGKGQPYSICFWVKGPSQNDKRVYSESSSTSNRPIVTFGTGRTSNTTTDKFQVYIRNDQNRVVCNGYSTATVFDGKWHHVAWVDASGQTALYVDGKLDSTIRYSTPPGADNFGTFTMNQSTAGAITRVSPCCHFTGAIDDLRVYQFALSASDVVLVTRNIPLVPLSGSIGYWGRGCNGALSIWGTGSTAPGGTLSLSLSRGLPGAAAQLVVGAPLSPLDLTAIGFSGCLVYPALQSSVFIAVGTTDAAGTVSPINLTIPNIAALNGVLGTFQGWTVKSGSLALSNALLLHIGR